MPRILCFKLILGITFLGLLSALHAQAPERAPRASLMGGCYLPEEKAQAVIKNAEAGKLMDRNQYAAMLTSGSCVRQDIDKAISIFSELIQESELPFHKEGLACALLRRGQKNDIAEAFKILKMPQLKKDYRSMLLLSKMYTFGIGRPQNDRKAKQLIRKAAKIYASEWRDAVESPDRNLRRGTRLYAGSILRDAVCLEPDFDGFELMKKLLTPKGDR